ncbi:hypothetical protein SPSINT_2176 [Staphylococcus pseudintermedius HKU10-03]|nr:hypothetical protein SPSINT_2176 [Staphylococcus pseudintermedius HKU10-03]
MLISKRGKKPNILAKIADISFPPLYIEKPKIQFEKVFINLV